MADTNYTNIQWYPGHMTKTMRLISKELKNVEIVAEILDARIPRSSQNPELQKLCARKPRFFILTKKDLADGDITQKWIRSFEKENMGAIAINTKQAGERERLLKAIDHFAKEHISSTRVGKPRIMFVGVPNVGKSSVINIIMGQNLAKVENRPGVTRGKQWLTAETFELLDMPGVLWPKFEDMGTAYHLAYTGAIKDDIFDVEEIAVSLLRALMETSASTLYEALRLEEQEGEEAYDLLGRIAAKRGFLFKGAIPDTEKAARIVLQEARAGKYGALSLEEP